MTMAPPLFCPTPSILLLSLLSVPYHQCMAFSFLPRTSPLVPLHDVLPTLSNAGQIRTSMNPQHRTAPLHDVLPTLSNTGQMNPSSRVLSRPASSLHATSSDDDDSVRISANIPENRSIPGLMADEAFAFRSAVHKTLGNLRTQLPQTLTVPLDPTAARQTYAADCTVIGPKGDILTTDRDEIISLSNTIATAIGTARRAGRLASTLASRVADVDKPSDDGLDLDLVDCELTLDSSLTVMHVKWTTTLPNAAASRPNRPPPGLVGSSVFTFCKDGLISKHQVLHVELDGRSIDAVGETLSSLRRTVKSVTETVPWVLEAAEAAGPLLADLAVLASSSGSNRGKGIAADNGRGYKDSVEGVSNEAEDTKEHTEAPLYVTDVPESQRNNASMWKKSARWDLDAFALNATESSAQYPFPGSSDWPKYESAHHTLQYFVNITIPYLSGEIDPVSTTLPGGKSFRDLFSTDVELRAFDGSTLVKGRGRVSDLYRAASSLRESGGVAATSDDAWKMTDVAVDWSNLTAKVKWLSNIQVKVEGTDKFYLDNEGNIKQIDEKELIVGGSKIIDAGWLRAIISAVETSRGGAGGEILGDVLKRISRGRGGSSQSQQVLDTLRQNAKQCPPELETAAAAAVYNIIRVLHAELPSIAEASPGSKPLTPAKAFISDDVELRGLLDERLARGINAYSQAVSASIGSLRAAVRTGSVRKTRDVVPRIEVTQSGNIKVSIEINLRIEAPSLPTLPVRNTRKSNNDKEKNGSRPSPLLDIGIPLDLELVSSYKVDRSGQIIEHRIVENRINGQKSPADVVSNWVKRGASDGVSLEGNVQAFVDAVKWARSISGN